MPKLVSPMMARFPRFRPKYVHAIAFSLFAALAYGGLTIGAGLLVIPAAIPMQLRMGDMYLMYGIAFSELALGAFIYGQYLAIRMRLRVCDEVSVDELVFFGGMVIWATIAPFIVAGY